MKARYTDHRDELIALQRAALDGNVCAKDGTPIREAIAKLTIVVKEERATLCNRETPVSYETSLNP